MNIKTLTVYMVTTNSDLLEGRGRTITLGYYLNQSDAVIASLGKGVMGSNAEIEAIEKTCVLFDNKIHIIGDQVQEKYSPTPREIALAKLTDTDKRALNLL